MKLAIVLQLLIVLLAGICSRANASEPGDGLAGECTEIFSNYEPGATVPLSASWGIGARPPWEPIYRAMSFIVPPDLSDYVMHSLNVMIFRSGNVSADLMISLAADQDELPGSVLESYLFLDISPWSAGLLPLHASSIDRPQLVAGARYWITAAVTEPDLMSASWPLNDQGVEGLMGSHTGDASWSVWEAKLGSFRISGCKTNLIFADGFESGDVSVWSP